jgi:glucokinase
MYQSQVNDINEFLVRDAIRESGEVTRSALSERLDLSPASVSRIVRRLVEAGVAEQVAGASERPGRTSDIIRFNRRSGSVIAVDLGGTKTHGMVADLGAETLFEDFRPTFEQGDPASTLLTSLDVLRAYAEGAGMPVRAVVVGVPAVPDPDTGLVGSGPNVNWNGYDLIGLLREHLDEPFRVENDVTLAAIGQAWRGEGDPAEGFVTLSIGTGIGAAAFADGRVLRGRHNAAGEIGYLMTSREQLGAEPGVVAGLESVASGPAVAARAGTLIAAGAQTSLTADPTAQRVFEAPDDPVAREVIGELLDHVAMAIVGLTAVLDPARIIFDGSVGRALEPYVDELVARAGRRIRHLPELCFSRLGPNATLIGAIAGALALNREVEARAVVADIPNDGLRALATLPPYGEGASATGAGGSERTHVP